MIIFNLTAQGDIQGRYEAIDKESPIPTDRQVGVKYHLKSFYAFLLKSFHKFPDMYLMICVKSV
jgi:hypothetical protein